MEKMPTQEEIIISQSNKQAQLISTHNCIPCDRDLEKKHLDRAITLRTKNNIDKELPKEEDKEENNEEQKKRGRPPIDKSVTENTP